MFSAMPTCVERGGGDGGVGEGVKARESRPLGTWKGIQQVCELSRHARGHIAGPVAGGLVPVRRRALPGTSSAHPQRAVAARRRIHMPQTFVRSLTASNPGPMLADVAGTRTVTELRSLEDAIVTEGRAGRTAAADATMGAGGPGRTR